MFSLPIQQYQVNGFAYIWSRYDPNATGLIDRADLDDLILRLANSNDCQDIIVLKDLVIVDESARKRFIGYLKIPTYD